MAAEEQTYLQLKGIEIMMKDNSYMFMVRWHVCAVGHRHGVALRDEMEGLEVKA